MTVIPWLQEGRLWHVEFRVTHGEDAYLIYINAMTGEEEMVLQMIIDETGFLTM